MHLLKISLVVTVLVFLSYTTKTECCTTVSFKDIDVWVDYNKSQERNIRVRGCLSPVFTVLENQHTGPVTGMTIDYQEIQILKQEAVANFSKLNYIELQRNRISLIKERAFSDLPTLVFVTLRYNDIRFLEVDAFFNVPNLITLDVSNNQLQYFEQECLGNSGGSVTNLYLSFNYIESIHKESFTNLPNLHTVNMSHNNILYIHKKAFAEANTLGSLDLSYNRISHLPDNVFIPTPNIVILNLFSNNLTYLSRTVLESISQVPELTLLFNPFTCKCYDRIADWAEKIGKNLQNSSYFLCNTIEDFTNIPVCLTTDENECTTNPYEDLYSILHSEQPNYECFAVNYFTYRAWQKSPFLKVHLDIGV